MAKTIWKYQFPISQHFSIPMQLDAKVIAVQMQNGMPTMWAEVEPNYPKEARHFFVIGTGFQLEDGHSEYLGTIQDGVFVWHIYQ